MRRRPSAPGQALVVLALCAAAACDRTRPAPARDSPTPQTPGRAPTAGRATPGVSSSWDPTAGPALVVASATPGEALVVLPQYPDTTTLDSLRFDVAALQNAPVELFARGRLLGEAQLGVSVQPFEGGCSQWPIGHVTTPSGAVPAGWTAAFLRGRALPLRVDSIEALSRADSARLVADVARLASALPNDTSKAFHGLPFVVVRLRRFHPAPGIETIVADVVRKLSTEANPQQEQLLVVAERDSGAVTAPLEAAYAERVSGPEETLSGLDFVAAVLLGDARRPSLVFAHEYGDGVYFTLVERVDRAKWQRRWKSAYAGC